MRNWRIEEISDRLQAAALDAALWPDALNEIGRAADGIGAVLFCTDPHFVRPTASAELKPAAEAYMRQGWHMRDERYRGLPKILQTGIAVDEDFTSTEEIQRSPYYQDFLRRFGLGPFAGVGFKAGADLWVISVQRSEGQAAFDQRERRTLLSLWRPMSDAATLSRQLSFARLLGIADAFESMRQPCLVFNDYGKVLAMNGLALVLIGTAFDVKRDRVAFFDDRSQTNFDNLMQMLRYSPRASPTAPSTTVVKDRAGNPAALRAIPLTGWARFSFTNARAIVLIAMGKAKSESAAPVLVAAYGLTTAEARFAAALLSGLSIRKIAEQSAVSYETARSHLRSLFLKTGTHRQGELVARLSQHVDQRNE